MEAPPDDVRTFDARNLRVHQPAEGDVSPALLLFVLFYPSISGPFSASLVDQHYPQKTYCNFVFLSLPQSDAAQMAGGVTAFSRDSHRPTRGSKHLANPMHARVAQISLFQSSSNNRTSSVFEVEILI